MLQLLLLLLSFLLFLDRFNEEYKSKKSYRTASASPTTKISIKSDNGNGLALAQGPPAMIKGSSDVLSSLLNGIPASLKISNTWK